MSTIRAISLFSGCGGADLGLTGGFAYLNKRYNKTLFEIVAASDIDRKAVDTYNLNFRHKAKVLDVKNQEFPKGFADIVIGGFPCQAFSTVNPTKQPEKRENQLFWEMSRIIKKVKPKAFIAENVKGFYRLNKGKYFQMAQSEFEKLGYKIFHDILNSSDYGIPQQRERLFMVGIKRSLKLEFKFPVKTHGETGNCLKPKVPLNRVIDNLIPADPKYYFSKRAVEGVKRAKPNMKRALAQDLNGQCLTISSHLAKVSLNSRDPVLLVDASKELYRRFSPKEAARIQSFPDRFVFAGSEADAYRQIGNAVPPVLMWYLAVSVSQQIFNI